MEKGYKLYAAYGFFINRARMADKCPTARFVGTSEIKDRRLVFRGQEAEATANAEPLKGCSVPVVVWEITPADETALDRCEGFPALRRKETVKVRLEGKTVTAMMYIINEETLSPAQPGSYYFGMISDGYTEAGFDENILRKALADSVEAEEAAPEKPL
jgi:gamma-glutamylcyclotransferase (GGCT)/AIG2-like uncharacterized protein YtfP